MRGFIRLTFHQKSILALIAGFIYLVWLLFVLDGTVGILFYILELFIFSLFVLFVINHWTRSYKLHGGSYSIRAVVDVFIPTKNESKEILEKTFKSVINLEYPNVRIYTIDDGNRPFVKKLAEKYGITYLVRSEASRKAKAFKAAALNFAFQHSFGNFILVLDADQAVQHTILDTLLGHFKDERVAFVSSRQQFDIDEADFNHDNLFYEFMLAGKNADNAAISCGSGVIYRRNALTDIGGFQEWNIVEDFYTSYVFHTKKWKTIYVNQGFSKGEAPTDLKTIYKQRGTWATDTLRVFFWKMPLLNKNLSIRQRLHYFEMGYIYLISALMVPGIYLLNIYSISFNQPILHVGIWYFLFKLPSLYLILSVYNELGQGSASSRMWAALFPVYFLATIRSLLYVKPAYVVTQKGVASRNRYSLVLPQFTMLSLSYFAMGYHILHFGLSMLLVTNFYWVIIMSYWLWPVFPKAMIHKKKLHLTHFKPISHLSVQPS